MSVATVGRGRYRYYLETVAAGWEDHRALGLEPDGTWEGGGPATLGLAGAVSERHLAAVMNGVDPVTGEVLRRSAVGTAAFDLTFSAPKPVSLLFALSDRAVANEVLRAHSAAVRATLSHLEQAVATAWRGSGGRREQIAVDGVVAAGFVHRTSRAADPHLHTHLLVANLARGADGRWSAIDGRAFFSRSPVLSSLYYAHLRHELVRSLGVVWEMRTEPAGSRIELAGIGPEARWAFSRRRQEVESWLDERGRGGPRWSRAAALATRAPKDPTLSFDALRPWWAARARAAGLGVEELASVVGRGPARSGPPGGIELVGRAVVERAVAKSGGLSRPSVLKGWADALAPGAPVPAVEALSDTLLESRLVSELVTVRGLSRSQLTLRQDEDDDGAPSMRRASFAALVHERDRLASSLLPSMPPDPGSEVRRVSAARAAALRPRRPSELAALDVRLCELDLQVARRVSWAVEHRDELEDLARINHAIGGREHAITREGQELGRSAEREGPALGW